MDSEYACSISMQTLRCKQAASFAVVVIELCLKHRLFPLSCGLDKHHTQLELIKPNNPALLHISFILDGSFAISVYPCFEPQGRHFINCLYHYHYCDVISMTTFYDNYVCIILSQSHASTCVHQACDKLMGKETEEYVCMFV